MTIVKNNGTKIFSPGKPLTRKGFRHRLTLLRVVLIGIAGRSHAAKPNVAHRAFGI
jgi:hypothetical protein